MRNILGKIVIRMNKRIFATTIGISLCVMYLAGTMAMVTGLHQSTENAANMFDEEFLIVYNGFTLSESTIVSEDINKIPGEIAKCSLVPVTVAGIETRVMSIDDPHNLLGGVNITLLNEILPGKSFPRPVNATMLNITSDFAELSINITTKFKPYTSLIFPDHWILSSRETVSQLNPDLKDGCSFLVVPSDNKRALDVLKETDFHIMQSVSVIKYFELGFYQVESNLWGIVLSSALIIVILVYNIMRIEIRYRIPDIKIIKYLGASPKVVMGVFVLQSLFISFIGGVLGLSLGIMAANGIVSASQLLGFVSVLVPQITLFTVGLPLGMTLLSGFLGGLLPAYKASKTVIRTSREVL